MNHAFIRLLPLADIDRFQAMRGGLRRGAEVNYTNQLLLLLLVVAVVAAVILAVRMFNSYREKPCYHPRGLFRELSRAHGLTREQHRLLRELAEGLELEHPGRLFLEADLFDRLYQIERFAPWQSGARREKANALRERLFGGELKLDLALPAQQPSGR